MLALGLVSRRIGSMPESAADVLNRFVVQVCVPAMVLRHVPRLSLTSEVLWLGLTPWLLTAVSVPLVLGAARGFGWSRSVTAALLLVVPLGNTSFIGYPMVRALFGESSLPLAVVYDQLGSFVLLSTYGIYVVARYEGGTPPDARTMAFRLLRFPPFVALLVALLPRVVPGLATALPASLLGLVDETLAGIGRALVPVAMFAVALKMRLGLPTERSAFAFGMLAKLGLLPLLAFGIVKLVDPSADVARVLVIESAMPPMITAGAMAMAAGFASELAAALVGYGIVVAMCTLPAWAHVVG